MAGDWIKMRMDLQDDPAVLHMARTLGCDAFAVIGRLHRLWCWADRHVDAKGVAQWVDFDFVDAECRQPGFAEAMSQVGWLERDGNALMFPNFCTHNGESAKKRSTDARRKREARANTQDVRNVSAKCPQKSGQVSEKCPQKNGHDSETASADFVTREEKRRVEKSREEEEKNSLSGEIESPDRERELVIAIMRAFDLSQPSPAYRKELDRLAGILAGRLADGEDAVTEIRARIAVAEKKWRDGQPTPNAIIDKHWDALRPKKAPPPRDFEAEWEAERRKIEEQRKNAITPEEARELLRQNNPFRKAKDDAANEGEAGEHDVSGLAEPGGAENDAGGDAAGVERRTQKAG